jgi:hypothetical protein
MTQTDIDGNEWTQEQIDAYDRKRAPLVYSHHKCWAREQMQEAARLRKRGLPGDRFRAAKELWWARNNERAAERTIEWAAELGVVVGEPQRDLFGA